MPTRKKLNKQDKETLKTIEKERQKGNRGKRKEKATMFTTTQMIKQSPSKNKEKHNFIMALKCTFSHNQITSNNMRKISPFSTIQYSKFSLKQAKKTYSTLTLFSIDSLMHICSYKPAKIAIFFARSAKTSKFRSWKVRLLSKDLMEDGMVEPSGVKMWKISGV